MDALLLLSDLLDLHLQLALHGLLPLQISMCVYRFKKHFH